MDYQKTVILGKVTCMYNLRAFTCKKNSKRTKTKQKTRPKRTTSSVWTSSHNQEILLLYHCGRKSGIKGGLMSNIFS